MSGAKHSAGDETEQDEVPAGHRPGHASVSPGRYSMAKDGSMQIAAVRIDSTRLAAVRPASVAPPQPPPLPIHRKTSPHGIPIVAPVNAGLPNTPQAPMRGITAVAPPPSASARPPIPVPSRVSGMTRVEKTPTGLGRVEPSKPSNGESRPPPPSFDEGSIAHAFDALMSEGTSGEAGRATVDLAPVRELFAELAANHMRHVRDFMIDVKWGEATRGWVEICIPAVTSLRRAAERLELRDLELGLDRFGVELHAALHGPAGKGPAAKGAPSIEGAAKNHLLDAYDELARLLPQAFALDRDKSQREAVIVQSLCLSVPDVRKVTIDKLHAAGLTSLKTLFEASADEVAQVAGIPVSLAVRIVERFQAYRRELSNASPGDARAAERERLATLTDQLLAQHDGYEEASKGWSDDAKARKRDLFRAREETWLAISLLLARFGEVERLQGIEKVPFAQRIAQLSEYLDEARDLYRSE